jgi:hypothetical protein
MILCIQSTNHVVRCITKIICVIARRICSIDWISRGIEVFVELVESDTHSYQYPTHPRHDP